MTVTELRGVMPWPGPATVNVVAQSGTTESNPMAGLAFAAVLSREVANDTDAPFMSMPETPPEQEALDELSVTEAVNTAPEPATLPAGRSGRAVPGLRQDAGGTADPREGEMLQDLSMLLMDDALLRDAQPGTGGVSPGDVTLKPAAALRIDAVRQEVITRGDAEPPQLVRNAQGSGTRPSAFEGPTDTFAPDGVTTKSEARLPGAGPATLSGQAAEQIEPSPPRLPMPSGGGGVPAGLMPATSDTPVPLRLPLSAAGPDALSFALGSPPVSTAKANAPVVEPSGATPVVAPGPPAPAPETSSIGAVAAPSATSIVAAGTRLAPASAAVMLIPALRAAPSQAAVLQAGVSTSLVATMSKGADPLGLVETGLGALEPRAPAPMVGTAPLPTTVGQDILRQIAIRIAHAGESGPGGTRGIIELNLSPEELGRVRLRLHPSEAGLSVTITTDRPETLDLMRRNIDLLAREFLEIGYLDAQFDFAQEGQGSDPGQAPPPFAPAPALDTTTPGADSSVPAALLALGARLDIRL